jgi:hypothetical protein
MTGFSNPCPEQASPGSSNLIGLRPQEADRRKPFKKTFQRQRMTLYFLYLMDQSDPRGSHPHPSSDVSSPLIGHGSRQLDKHHLDGVSLCSVSMHPPGLGTGCGFWAFDQLAAVVA